MAQPHPLNRQNSEPTPPPPRRGVSTEAFIENRALTTTSARLHPFVSSKKFFTAPPLLEKKLQQRKPTIWSAAAGRRRFGCLSPSAAKAVSTLDHSATAHQIAHGVLKVELPLKTKSRHFMFINFRLPGRIDRNALLNSPAFRCSNYGSAGGCGDLLGKFN